jgi:hypothetical protein
VTGEATNAVQNVAIIGLGIGAIFTALSIGYLNRAVRALNELITIMNLRCVLCGAPTDTDGDCVRECDHLGDSVSLDEGDDEV